MIKLSISFTMATPPVATNAVRHPRFRRPRVQHAIRVHVILRHAIALRRLRYASTHPVTPTTLQPRNVLQGISIGNVHLQVRLADHDMTHVSADFLFAIAAYVNNLIEQRVVAMRTSAGGA